MSNASRWRRFGFFDRSTLSLPDDVWDDLVPEEALRDAIASGKLNRQYHQQQQQQAGGGSRPTGGADDALLAHTKLLHLSCATVSFHPSLLPAPRLEKVGETVMMSACTSVGASCFPTGIVPSGTTTDGGGTSDVAAKVSPSGTAVDQLTISTTDGNTSTATGTGTAHATNPAASFYYTCGLQLATLGNRNRAFLTSSPFQQPQQDGSSTTSQNPYSTLLSPLHGSLVFAYNNTCGGPTPTSSSAASGGSAAPTSPVMEKVTRIFQSACAISGNTGMTSPSSSAVTNSSTMLLQAAFHVSSTPDSLAAAVLTMGTLVLAFVSSPHSGLVHCVDVSMRCHPPSKDHQTTKAKLLGGKDNVRNSLYDTTTATPRNNEDQETDTTTAHKKTQSNTTIPALADQMSAITLEELEDLDGWRGFVNPFWKVIQQQSQQQTSASTGSASLSSTAATTARERAIVQEHMMSSSTEAPSQPQQRALPKIAAMSVYSTSHEARRKKSSQALLGRVLFQGGKNNKNKDGGGTDSSTTTTKNTTNNQNALQELVGHLYVAVATNELMPSEGTGLCIMVDPHLRLETDLSSALEGVSTAASDQGKPSSSSGMIMYRPRVMSSKHNYYKFTCMDLRPPLLVVGTTIGVTLVYQFTPLEYQKQSSSSPSRTTMDLILKMEIPPPGISLKDVHTALSGSTKQPSSHLVPVTSVQLTAQQQSQKESSTTLSLDTTGAAANTTKKGSTGLKIGNQLSIGVGGPSHLFVCYGTNDGGRSSNQGRGGGTSNNSGGDTTVGGGATGGGGICCYNLLNTVTTSVGSTGSSTTAPLGVGATNVPRSRIDLDTRGLHSHTLTDVIVRTTTTTSTVTQDTTSNNDGKGKDEGVLGQKDSPSNDTMTQQPLLQREECFQICWSDGLYTYTPTKRFNAIPIEGTKIAFCSLSSKHSVADDNLDNNEPLGMARHRRQPLLSSSSSSSSKADVLPFVASTTTMDGGGTLTNTTGTLSYSLVATWDGKSGRDAVDIYDTTNKLCAFHVLLSPNHRATQVSGICTPTSSDGRKGRNSAIIVTSGGAVITLTEKDTIEKVALLVDKELYAAAISLAFMDPYYPTSDIIELYVRYAEYLYDVKQDFEQSMEQYISTIGSIEPSFVITKFLDAPKIPLLVKYLKELRRHQKATHVHMELLRTCYLKLNNIEAAEQIATSSALGIGTGNGMDNDDDDNNNSGMMMMYGGGTSGGGGGGPSSSAAAGAVLANLMAGDRPAEALATLCALEAPQVANALKVHGATLARSLPRETAGIVMSLCDGTFSSDWSKQQQQQQKQQQTTSQEQTTASETDTTNAATSGATKTKSSVNNLFQDNRVQTCEKYPASWFVNAFVEHPKLLRLVLAHCKRNHCDLEPTLRRTHLELTLEEWNNAKRTGDVEMERIRSKEAMTALTDSHAEELGIYEALVLVHQANFTLGEILLLEQLQMSNMLLERYAQIGGHRERRQMIAMCQTDSELLADVMSYFVHMASRKAKKQQKQLLAEKEAAAAPHDEKDDDSKTTLGSGGTHQNHDTLEDIYDDLKETLELARTQKVLLPIRVARILAGEGPGSFSNERLLDQLRNKSHAGNTDEKKVGEWNNDDDDTENETSSLMWSQKALARLHSVPLDIAMDYMSGVLNESNSELTRLKAEIVEYTKSCNDMEQEIKSLRALASGKADEDQDPEEWYIPNEDHSSQHNSQRMMPDLDIDELYQMLQEADATNSNGLSEHPSTTTTNNNMISLHMEEEFWREMDLSDDRFDTICRFFAKGIIP